MRVLTVEDDFSRWDRPCLTYLDARQGARHGRARPNPAAANRVSHWSVASAAQLVRIEPTHALAVHRVNSGALCL